MMSEKEVRRMRKKMALSEEEKKNVGEVGIEVNGDGDDDGSWTWMVSENDGGDEVGDWLVSNEMSLGSERIVDNDDERVTENEEKLNENDREDGMIREKQKGNLRMGTLNI